MRSALPPRDLALIAVVVVAWGSNFTAMKLALEELPPFLFVALRFAILLPALALVAPPRAPWFKVAAVGLLINMGQFAFLFAALRADVSAGLASLLLQTQAPLTILLAAVFWREAVSPRQITGIAVAVCGLALVGLSAGGSVTPLGLALVLAGALCWALGNLVLKSLPGTAMLPVFLRASLVPPLPMLALSWATEGPAPLATIAALSAQGWAAVVYVALISTVLGYSLWGALIARHSAATITPFALLIPVVGLLTAAVILGERLTMLEGFGVAIILSGLALCVLRPSRVAKRQA